MIIIKVMPTARMIYAIFLLSSQDFGFLGAWDGGWGAISSCDKSSRVVKPLSINNKY